MIKGRGGALSEALVSEANGCGAKHPTTPKEDKQQRRTLTLMKTKPD